MNELMDISGGTGTASISNHRFCKHTEDNLVNLNGNLHIKLHWQASPGMTLYMIMIKPCSTNDT